jgi:hypothetical protein
MNVLLYNVILNFQQPFFDDPYPSSMFSDRESNGRGRRKLPATPGTPELANKDPTSIHMRESVPFEEDPAAEFLLEAHSSMIAVEARYTRMLEKSPSPNVQMYF